MGSFSKHKYQLLMEQSIKLSIIEIASIFDVLQSNPEKIEGAEQILITKKENGDIEINTTREQIGTLTYTKYEN